MSLSELMYRFPISHGLRFCTIGKMRISSIDSICIKVLVLKFGYSKSSVKKNVTYISVLCTDLYGEGDFWIPLPAHFQIYLLGTSAFKSAPKGVKK